MRKRMLALVLAPWLLLASCDDLPTGSADPVPPEPTPTPAPTPSPTPTPGPTPTPRPSPTPTPTPTPTPIPSGPVRLEVTGTSCGGNVRWDVGSNDNDSGDDVAFPWSLTVTGRLGDGVSLRACHDCEVEDEDDDVTITVSVIWQGRVIATQTRRDEPRDGQCRPSASVETTLR